MAGPGFFGRGRNSWRLTSNVQQVMSGERRNKAIAPYALPAGLRPAQSLVGARKLAVEGDEFAAERLRKPEVARIVDRQRGLLGQDEGLREIDRLELDRQRIEQPECLQQGLAFRRSRPDFPRALHSAVGRNCFIAPLRRRARRIQLWEAVNQRGAMRFAYCALHWPPHVPPYTSATASSNPGVSSLMMPSRTIRVRMVSPVPRVWWRMSGCMGSTIR